MYSKWHCGNTSNVHIRSYTGVCHTLQDGLSPIDVSKMQGTRNVAQLKQAAEAIKKRVSVL